MIDVLSWLAQYGGWGLLIIVVILIIAYYDKIEKPVAKIYELFSWAGACWRRRAVKADIQGNVNAFSRSVEQEVPNTMPYKMKLQFVRELDRAELLQEKNLVLVRIRDRRHDDKNLVHAMLAFCPVGLLPVSRPYLDDALGKAVDYTTMRKLLSMMGHHSALNYFYEEVLEPEVARKRDLEKLCVILDGLDEKGLFTKVILRELRDFGGKVGSRYPTKTHKDETRQFVEYMDVVAKRVPGEEIDTQFQGNHISMGFVFIGTSEKVKDKGLVTYLQAIQYKKGMSIERVYLAARDRYIDIAERAAYLAERKGFAKVMKRPVRYYATDRDGHRREHVIIEMRTIVSTPFAPTQQGMLLEE